MPPSRASTSTRHTRATRSNTASAHAHAGGIPSASTLIVDEGPEQGQETERETSHPPAQVARRRTTTRSGNSRHNRQASRGPLTSAPTTIKQLSKTESEIIEISSDDEEVPLAAQQLVGDLRKQLKKLKEEVTKFKQECKKKEQENAKLKSIIALQPPKDGIYIDTGDLEDATNCEICSTPMWRPVIAVQHKSYRLRPYILPTVSPRLVRNLSQQISSHTPQPTDRPPVSNIFLPISKFCRAASTPPANDPAVRGFVSSI
ncbi:hypothetical protein AX16_010602 [Volvariella volvacea WC 439]|nr:hypothetical protein AX16_010602 [Volvariella volvacea WC 439]